VRSHSGRYEGVRTSNIPGGEVGASYLAFSVCSNVSSSLVNTAGCYAHAYGSSEASDHGSHTVPRTPHCNGSHTVPCTPHCNHALFSLTRVAMRVLQAYAHAAAHTTDMPSEDTWASDPIDPWSNVTTGSLARNKCDELKTSSYAYYVSCVYGPSFSHAFQLAAGNHNSSADTPAHRETQWSLFVVPMCDATSHTLHTLSTAFVHSLWHVHYACAAGAARSTTSSRSSSARQDHTTECATFASALALMVPCVRCVVAQTELFDHFGGNWILNDNAFLEVPDHDRTSPSLVSPLRCSPPCLPILLWQAFQYVPLNGTGYYESWRVAQRDRVVEQFTAQIAKLRSNSTSW
jgi:hypothetical protein